MKGFTPLLLQQFEKKATKDIALKSRWSQLSNRVEGRAIPVEDDFKLPDSVVHEVSKKHKKGDWSVTVPLVEALKEDGVGGSMIAKGTEERPGTKSCKTFYNNVRKAITLETDGVEFDAVSYLNLGGQSTQLISDWYVADDDYSAQRALCLGADRYLTEAMYWNGNTEITSAPVSVAHHPNIAYRGMSAAITRHATFATDQANINTALANMAPATIMDRATVESMARYAARFVTPLGWTVSGQVVNWIVFVSEYQADQLRSDTSWVTLMQNADKRGPENRAIAGIVAAPYRGLLLVEDSFSPIWHMSTTETGTTGFEFVTPVMANTINATLGLGALNRVVKGASTVPTGTCEVARIMGKGAIAMPTPEALKFSNAKDDYEFFSGLCGSKKQGHQRMDFIDKAGTTKKNIGSALFFTATPAIQY